MNNTKLTVDSPFKVHFHELGGFASNLDPVIPQGTILEYIGDINKHYLIDSKGGIISSRYQTCTLQYVPVTWNGEEGFVCKCDVRVAA